jgi:potassium-transporting ATPase KdpC subunit
MHRSHRDPLVLKIKAMFRTIFHAVKLTLLSIVLCIVAYPLIILGFAQLGPNHGLGQTVASRGRVVGYALVGQSFSRPNYFWGRPSAAAYNASGSAGSNKGPTNPDYLKDVQSRVDSILAHHPGVKAAEIPADLVTSSGSGLDPDISVGAAMIQAGRVAQARAIPEAVVQQLIQAHTHEPLLGLMGTRRVNVLELNLALDNAHP